MTSHSPRRGRSCGRRSARRTTSGSGTARTRTPSAPPRGAAQRVVQASFVRAEPLVVPKRSLPNSAAERVDVRVLQVIYELPPGATGENGIFRVGQQVDAFIGDEPTDEQDFGAPTIPHEMASRCLTLLWRGHMES